MSFAVPNMRLQPSEGVLAISSKADLYTFKLLESAKCDLFGRLAPIREIHLQILGRKHTFPAKARAYFVACNPHRSAVRGWIQRRRNVDRCTAAARSHEVSGRQGNVVPSLFLLGRSRRPDQGGVMPLRSSWNFSHPQSSVVRCRTGHETFQPAPDATREKYDGCHAFFLNDRNQRRERTHASVDTAFNFSFEALNHSSSYDHLLQAHSSTSSSDPRCY